MLICIARGWFDGWFGFLQHFEHADTSGLRI